MATRRQTKRALDQHQDRLIQLDNVVGLGIVPDEESGEMRVAVYVSRKLPKSELSKDQIIPGELPLPGSRKKVRTKVIEQGLFGLEM